MNNIKKNMFMVTGAWGSGRNLREQNENSGDYYTDKRWPRARRLYHHPDNCYNSWPNIIANNINATVHWVGSDDNHITNTLSTFELFFNSIEGRYEDGINFYFVVFNGIYDLENKFKVDDNADFWTNYKKASKFQKDNLMTFNRGWISLKEIIKQSSYNDRMVFIMQDKEKIDDEYRRDDHPSIADQLNDMLQDYEYVYFARQPMDEIVQEAHKFGSEPFDGPTLDKKQNETFGNNLYSWLTERTNCFIM